MVRSQDCIQKYGVPNNTMEYAHLTMWNVPDWIISEIPTIPKRIYCNKDLIKPLEQAFAAVIANCLTQEIISWDGCFNIRKQRGYNTWSLHAWAIAIDINAARNPLGQVPVMSPALVKCFTDNGFDWGGTWSRPDGMHFQLSRI
ncbi:M15 family metallopeptidase [Zunongwangia sp. SCSIO 43204]|uniref:M15 family metallopeptidase n=1 Tax=Zunongwangia sp. SCSIO 43204 TaxID=2779359 RepID=UPI001CA93A63|nr:M15 family metallopeptidase [Zunongwangia sp. SCSIO 43204]UAB84980.1 M15 family metallopeptidase [Zunongwangia sp. SCSIO 43204]